MAEIRAQRRRDAKHFALDSHRRQAIFAPNQHYLDDQGNWQNVNLTFTAKGGGVYLADRHELNYRADVTGLAVWHRQSGRGIKFLFPKVPDRVTGKTAEWDVADGTTWKLQARKTGLKTTALVPSRRGPRTYRFDAQMLGGLAPPVADSEGNLVQPAGHFTIVRPHVIGANGVRYETSGWRIVAGEAAFDFDDTPLPNAALPYTIDPTTTFNVAASGDDGEAQDTGVVYPPLGATTTVTTTATEIRPEKGLSGGTFTLAVALIRWDTSSLPDDAAITGATLRIQSSAKQDIDDRSLTAEWYEPGTIGTEDWTSTVGTDAHAGTDITSFTTGVDKDLALENLSSINRQGYTGLRLHVSGGEPTSANSLAIISLDYPVGSDNEPRLLVTYFVPEFHYDYSRFPKSMLRSA